MGSLDVESLFTNVPLDETISIKVDKIFKDNKSTFHGLKHVQFRELMIIATQNSHFQFWVNCMIRLMGWLWDLR